MNVQYELPQKDFLNKNLCFKGAQVIFDVLDFNDFFIMKSIYVGRGLEG